MSELPDPLRGQMIRGYSLEHLLGRGALTAVYYGQTQENWQLPELIITVFLLPETLDVAARGDFMRRFSREARQLIHLRHPHLLPVYGSGEHEGYPYLLTPNTTGTSLAARLRERRRWSPSEVLALLAPVASALDYLHAQGFVCQFFSPTNILLQDDATAMLTGIGVTRLPRNEGLLHEENVSYPHLRSIAATYLGTPEYLAPEVIQGKKIDGRADIYSLGILLFELLSGSPPFQGKNYVDTARKHLQEPLPSLQELCPDLPLALEIVTNRALHRNPERRYQKAGELVAAYGHALDDYLKASKHLSLLRTVEQIRALPAPAPSVTLMLPAPQQIQKSVAPSWPYALLTDIQQVRPQITAELSQLSTQLQLPRTSAHELPVAQNDPATENTHRLSSEPLSPQQEKNYGEIEKTQPLSAGPLTSMKEVQTEAEEEVGIFTQRYPHTESLEAIRSEQQGLSLETQHSKQPAKKDALKEAWELTQNEQQPPCPAASPQKAIDTMAQEMRSIRERLQNRSQVYSHSREEQ